MRKVKITISMDENVYRAAEHSAALLGMSRSELYSAAIRHYLVERRKPQIREEYDRFYAEHGDDEEDTVILAGIKRAARRVLEPEKW